MVIIMIQMSVTSVIQVAVNVLQQITAKDAMPVIS